MATTSLWHIKGRLGDLISYVENPEKTVPKEAQDFFNVFDYVRRESKTRDEYVTAINCLKQTALQQMILTKQRYGKWDKYIAWHGYQSFKIGEVTPDVAHEIGVKLAKEMWGDRFQIVVTTHLDKDHIHNHFCFNSVSFRDGGKYNYSKAELKHLRDISDRLCREYGLSVIEKPHKAPSRPVWLDEKSGKPTRYNVYRNDIYDAFTGSRNLHYAENYLRRMGYITDFTGKHWKIRLPQYEHFTRIDTLEPEWTPEYLTHTLMGRQASFGNVRPVVTFSPYQPEEQYKAYTPHKPTSHIYRLYLFYCYELGILPKHRRYEPTSPYLKEDLRRLDELTRQVDYMAEHKIETLEDLLSDRQAITSSLNELCAQRRQLQNRIRRAPTYDAEVLRQEKTELSKQIAKLRSRLRCNTAIEARAVKIQENLDRVEDNELRAEAERQKKNERNRER